MEHTALKQGGFRKEGPGFTLHNLTQFRTFSRDFVHAHTFGTCEIQHEMGAQKDFSKPSPEGKFA